MLIAYADDDIDDFSIVSETLAEIDSRTRCINAMNGQEMLNLLENLTVLPDVILLDINMPYMDGMSCLRAIRANTRFEGVPVYMYTNGKNPVDEAHCRALGATDYIVKHFSHDDMRHFFQGLVKKYA